MPNFDAFGLTNKSEIWHGESTVGLLPRTKMDLKRRGEDICNGYYYFIEVICLCANISVHSASNISLFLYLLVIGNYCYLTWIDLTCIAAKCADTREIAHQYEVVGESSYPFNGSISVDFIRNSYAVYWMVPFSMTLNGPWPTFQGHSNIRRWINYVCM